MALLDTTLFGILSAARKAVAPTGATKEAFTPSPAIAQAVMQQAQGGGGGDPSQGGAPPGGMPPGGDPAAMDAAMQGQPGPGGGAPPAPSGPQGDPSPGGSSDPALSAKLDQLTQLIQQQAQSGGGANGKPNMASVKFEPQHFHQIQHDLSNIKAVMMQLADAAGLQVPASTLIQQPPPGSPAPGDPNQAGAPGAQPGVAGPPGAQQPPPSNVAQQLPSLPPTAQKTASHEDIQRLANGFRVPSDAKPRNRSSVASIAKLAAAKLGRK